MKFLQSYKYCFFILTIVFLTSCDTTKYLQEGQSYLKGNYIEFEKGTKIKNRTSLEYELETLFKQTPNQPFLWTSRRYFYFAQNDTLYRSKFMKKWKKFEGRRLAEVPVYFDTAKANATADAMKYYLQNKGWFWAETEYYQETNKKGTKTKVYYVVKPNKQYTIDSIEFKSEDKKIEEIVNSISDESFLKKGKPVDVNLYNQEVARITEHLRNNGYAYFQPQHVGGLDGVDSADLKVKVILPIYPPTGQTEHKIYKVGDITIYPNYGQNFGLNQEPDTTINGIRFVNNGEPFRVKPKTLLNSVSLKTGELYNREKEINTNLQLSSLGVFSFVTIKAEPDTIQENVLNFYILLTQNKKWEFGADFDINQTERSGGEAGTRNLLGLSFSPSLKSRNSFKGAELAILSSDFGIEFTPCRNIPINTLDIGVQGDLYFPRFVDYLAFWKILNKVGLTTDDYYKSLIGRATSRISAGYNFYSLLDYYSYNLFNASMGYDIQKSARSRFVVNNLGVDFLFPNLKSRFLDIVAQNPFLENSFKRQFLTGFFLRDFTYIYSPALRRTGGTWYFQGTAESSGLEVFGLNKLFNAVDGSSNTWRLQDADLSKYFRVELDLRRYWQPRTTRTFVMRLNSGIIIPYADSEEAPYVKQFYVGGPQSIRGAYARGLGPGSYLDTTTIDLSQRNFFYQTGDIKLEWNIEYRFHMFRPLNLFDWNGAFFIDGGNIWTLDEDPNEAGRREGSKFELKNTFKQMAISVGTGVRWDFTYFIMRFDFGTLIRHNYPDPARNNTYWADFSTFKLKDRVAFHLGLGYPF